MNFKFKVLIILLLFTFSLAWSYSSNPPDGRTGAPGEGDCTGCHGSYALNSGDGSFIINVPSQYVPGDTLDITVNLEDLNQQRWGFEITVLDVSNNDIGVFLITDPGRTQLSLSNGRQYVKHTNTGTDNGTFDVSPGWSFKWIAPQSSGTGAVTFYAAGNAANGSGTSGDYIYTTSSVSNENQTITCYVDADEDNFGDINDPGSSFASECPVGSVDNNLDCNDNNFGINPEAIEIPNDGIDQDCNGEDLATICCDLPSDANNDQVVGISDLTYFVDYLFNSGPEPTCLDEFDNQADCVLGISDLTNFVDYLFNSGTAPVCGCIG